MKKINNSNFERIEDIIKNLDFSYNPEECNRIEEMKVCWKELVGEKISAMSKVIELSNNNVVTIACADSFVANELYFVKEKLLKSLKERVDNEDFSIKDIRFDYKKWEETDKQ